MARHKHKHPVPVVSDSPVSQTINVESERKTVPLIVESPAATKEVVATPSCESCIKWQYKGLAADGKTKLGLCRDAPPKIMQGHDLTSFGPIGIFPVTAADTFCHHYATHISPAV